MNTKVKVKSKKLPQAKPKQLGIVEFKKLISAEPKLAIAKLEGLYPKNKENYYFLSMMVEAYSTHGKMDKARKIALQAIKYASDTKKKLNLSRTLTRLGLNIQANQLLSEELSDGIDLQDASKVLFTATQSCDWQKIRLATTTLLDHYRSDNWQKPVETPRTHLLWCADEKINNKVFQLFAASQHGTNILTKPKVPKKLGKRKIRLGYMSSDFRNHPTAQLVKGLIASHNKAEFELIAYDTGYDDNSDMRKETLSLFDRYELLYDMSDKQAAEFLEEEDLDAIIELNGLTQGARLGILKNHPVPIQIDYLGFPGSVGGGAIDYIIADSYVLTKEVEKYYAEKIIRIEKTYQANNHINEKKLEPLTREQIGFSNDAFILGMFNNCNKISEEAWKTWVRILQRIPRSILWMLVPNEVAQKNLKASLSSEGIDPRRLVFAPRRERLEHFQRMAICDVMLDPWPYGGHTTTSDALYSGVPVIALKGTNFASRVSGGLLIAAGLPGLVVETTNDYVNGVVRLSNDNQLLSEIKSYLNKNKASSSIFNSAIKAKQIEEAIKIIINNRINGIPDKSINMTYKREGKS